MRRRRQTTPSPALTYFTPVSDGYEERTEYRLECYDKLPPVLREVIREALSDIHDPVELWQFARMRHNRPEALADQVKLRDNKLREEREAATKNYPVIPPGQRALRRHHIKYDTWELKKQADRAIPLPQLVAPTAPAEEPIEPVLSIGSSIMRWFRG